MKLYVFRTVRLPIIRSLYTHQWYMSYRFVDRIRAGPGWYCSKAVYKPVWHIPLVNVQWINSRWRTEELSETFRISWQNKFVKLVHLVGFITKKFLTMHGHMNVKVIPYTSLSFNCTDKRIWYDEKSSNDGKVYQQSATYELINIHVLRHSLSTHSKTSQFSVRMCQHSSLTFNCMRSSW